jgi:hypothetical protein
MSCRNIFGSVVNAILILAVLLVGLWSGLVIAVLSPVLAFLIVPVPMMYVGKINTTDTCLYPCEYLKFLLERLPQGTSLESCLPWKLDVQMLCKQ